MALDSASCATSINTAYEKVRAQKPNTYSADFASAYQTYADAGIIAGAISGGGDMSIIKGFMDSVTSDSITVSKFGKALADYWAEVGIEPAEPNIASVNNAALLVAAFTTAVNASITDKDTTPYFKTLIDNIEEVVKTIVWTITPPSPAPTFMSTII